MGIQSSPKRLAYLSISWQSENASEPFNLNNSASRQEFDQTKRTWESPKQVASQTSQNAKSCASRWRKFTQVWLLLLLLGSGIFVPGWFIFRSAVKVLNKRGKRADGAQHSSPADLGNELWRGVVEKKGGESTGAPEARALSLTCIPQKYSHHLSWAETQGPCVRPPFLSLNKKKDFCFLSKLNWLFLLLSSTSGR